MFKKKTPKKLQKQKETAVEELIKYLGTDNMSMNSDGLIRFGEEEIEDIPSPTVEEEMKVQDDLFLSYPPALQNKILNMVLTNEAEEALRDLQRAHDGTEYRKACHYSKKITYERLSKLLLQAQIEDSLEDE